MKLNELSHNLACTSYITTKFLHLRPGSSNTRLIVWILIHADGSCEKSNMAAKYRSGTINSISWLMENMATWFQQHQPRFRFGNPKYPLVPFEIVASIMEPNWIKCCHFHRIKDIIYTIYACLLNAHRKYNYKRVGLYYRIENIRKYNSLKVYFKYAYMNHCFLDYMIK